MRASLPLLVLVALSLLACSVAALRVDMYRNLDCSGSPFISASIPEGTCWTPDADSNGFEFSCSNGVITGTSWDIPEGSSAKCYVGTASSEELPSGMCIPTDDEMSMRFTCGASSLVTSSLLLALLAAFASFFKA